MLVAISLLSSITSTRMRHSCAAGARADQGCQLNKLGWDRRAGRVEETEWGFALARKRPRRTTRRRPSEPKLLPRYHRLPSPFSRGANNRPDRYKGVLVTMKLIRKRLRQPYL